MPSNISITTTFSVQPEVLSQYLSLTLGLIILICGIIGNCLIILIFLTFDNYKHNACSLYMFVGSLFDLLFLLIGLTTRTLSQGFNMDFTLINRVWCKFRSSLLDIISLCSFTCLCLQSIDVFFYTSRSASMRQRSNIKTARYLPIGFVLLWIVHEIPSFIYQDLILVNVTSMCLTTNAIYVSYHTYITTLFMSICVPITLISYFAFRIYRQLTLMNAGERRLIPGFSRQRTKMALFQIASVLIFQFPFGVATAYFVSTTNLAKSPDRQLRDKLTQTFFNVYVYGLYAVRNNTRLC